MSAFWRPGGAAPWETDRESAREQDLATVTHNPNARLSLDVQRRARPIAAVRREILYLLERYRTLVIVGSTGCGKTTQIPQFLNEAGWAADQRCVVMLTATARSGNHNSKPRGRRVGRQMWH